MSFLKPLLSCLVIAAAAGALTGCEQPGDNGRGTYTAARHMNTGSHVPQANDANSTSAVYAPAPGASTVGGTQTNASGAR